MANDNDPNQYRYLIDAKNSRQYAIPFDGNKPRKDEPIRNFAVDETEKGFKPNETIFAFDDEFERKFENGRATISTVAFQITTGPDAKPNGGKMQSVTYDVELKRTVDGVQVVYTLDNMSRKELAERDFDASFPDTFTSKLDLDEHGVILSDLRKIIVNPVLYNILPFPPHHTAGDAATARTEIIKAKKETMLLPDTRFKPRPTFNQRSGSSATPPAPVKYKVEDNDIERLIKKYCDDISLKAERGELDPVVGRDAELRQTMKILSRRKQSSVCYTGDAGVGKTAMFAGVAQYIQNGENVPETLQNARVLSLDLQAMNAGAKFRGDFEAKLKPLIDGLKERKGILKGRKIILSIDEIHSQGTAGKAEGGTDSFNMMKPFLTSQGISVMATTTSEEYKKHIEKDGALASRFEQMVLAQPDEASTLHILNKLWPGIKAHHKLAEDIAQEDIEYIVQMTNRYAPSESQPRKGEKALDMAAASAVMEGRSVIERSDLISAVAQMSKLSENFLNQSDHDRFLKMETELPKLVLGQPGVQRVVDGLIGSRVGLSDPDQPWGAFVFQGPTGTGKTELCKALARYLFGTEEALIKLDMAEYSEKHTVSRLIGAPPGYVGHDSSEPALTERIRQRPYSILLLDEVEKAHKDVFNILLSILNDGKVTDNHNKTVLFNNVIIVMTTNLGATAAMGSSMNFGGGNVDKDPAQVQAHLDRVYNRERKEFFRPEMINRIEELGGFVTFIPLATQVIEQLVDRELDKVSKRLSDKTRVGIKDVVLEASAEVKAQLSKEGYKPDMGARPMRKVVREKIQNPLAKWILGNKEKLLAHISEHGPTKIVIDSLTKFEPRLVSAQALLPAAVNDNAGQQTQGQKPAQKFSK